MKKILTLIVIIITISCDSLQEKYFKMYEGQWQTVKFYHKEKNLSNKTYIINFYDRNHFYIRDIESHNDNFVYSKYKLIEESKILKMEVECGDRNLSGDYTISIDTIGQDAESYHIQLTLGSKNNYIQAIRHKLKYYFYNTNN